jgi:hypothetical protein
MSNVIKFLENLGQDATLRHADAMELELQLVRAGIEPVMQMAIREKDQKRLEALLACSSNVCCGVFPGKEDEEEEEAPSKDDEEVRGQSRAA